MSHNTSISMLIFEYQIPSLFPSAYEMDGGSARNKNNFCGNQENQNEMEIASMVYRDSSIKFADRKLSRGSTRWHRVQRTDPYEHEPPELRQTNFCAESVVRAECKCDAFGSAT